MDPFLQAVILLALILAIARFIKRGSNVLQKFFIPSALVAGFGGLILGPQFVGSIPAEITAYWASWPKYLISIVFAGLFLGKVIPSAKEIWKSAGPMIAFGNTLAWGQYALGILATLLFLTPVFGTNPLAGVLIEISFEGGHGTAAGLAPTFAQLGWSEGTDVALGLATVSIVAAIILGLIFINWHSRKNGYRSDPELIAQQRQKMIRSGYNIVTLGRKIQSSPKAIAINILAFSVAIGIGWLILQGLIMTEDFALRNVTETRFFSHMPLFPLAMIGGLIVQMGLRKIGKQKLIKRQTARVISAVALDVLIASAIATVSINAIGNNLPVFITFLILGIGWIVFSFFVFAPRMFKTYWFEKGLTNIGQSMGMTATGLLMNRLVDPANKSSARESFAYKQLAFEPFMGGGLVTASSVIFLYEFGAIPVLIVVTAVTIFWMLLGFYMGHRRHKASQQNN